MDNRQIGSECYQGWWVGLGPTKAFVSAFGGQLLSLQLNGTEVLWCTDQPKPSPAALRGGVPICWPWFGPAQLAGQPQHGLVRTQIWRRVADNVAPTGSAPNSLIIEPSEPPPGWALSLEFQLTPEPAACTMVLTTRREPGAQPALLSQALHTYFQISPGAPALLTGLQGSVQNNLLPGKPRSSSIDPLPLVGPAGQATELMADQFDRAPRMRLACGTHTIEIRSPDARSVMIWNPGPGAGLADAPDPQWQHFVCVEVGQLGADARLLAPGQSLTLTQHLHLL